MFKKRQSKTSQNIVSLRSSVIHIVAFNVGIPVLVVAETNIQKKKFHFHFWYTEI